MTMENEDRAREVLAAYCQSTDRTPIAAMVRQGVEFGGFRTTDVIAAMLAFAATQPAPAPMGEDARVLVPRLPTDEQWDGLARVIMMWLDFTPHTPRTLFVHLERSGVEIPRWLRDEAEMQHLDHVPSKGTRCVLIYRAMVEAALAALSDHGVEME